MCLVFYCHDCICGTKYHITISLKVNHVNLIAKQNVSLAFILASTKPPWYVITTLITLGCPVNPVIDFGSA